MKKDIPFVLGICIVVAVAIVAGIILYYQTSRSLQPSVSISTPTSSSAFPITYTNNTYGFTFSLPADWKGYTIVTSTWNGAGDEACPAGACPSIRGPEILIRNPQWTKANPWQDIPIMIFTQGEWSEITSTTLIVSAAPSA
jgi:hypothetical protein